MWRAMLWRIRHQGFLGDESHHLPLSFLLALINFFLIFPASFLSEQEAFRFLCFYESVQDLPDCFGGGFSQDPFPFLKKARELVYHPVSFSL
jgi:hypothetical protein